MPLTTPSHPSTIVRMPDNLSDGELESGPGADPLGIQQFAFVQERDIDFLLVEELACSLPFRQLLLGAALPGIDIGSFTSVVLHSVSRGGEGPGETDIQVSLTPTDDVTAGPFLVLIENKVDAVFQPGQAARYRMAAAQAEKPGKYAVARTLLVAPAQYIESRPEAAEFDGGVSYEAIERHFRDRAASERTEMGERCAHRAALVALAISKARRDDPPVPNDRISDFWKKYYEFMRAEAPSLRMNRRAVQGSGSTWIRFSGTLDHHPPLPRAFLIHKLPHERVHLEFPGWAGRLGQLEGAIAATGFDESMSARPAGKSAAITIEVPVVDALKPFDEQVNDVRKGLQAAVVLQTWWNENWKLLLP